MSKRKVETYAIKGYLFGKNYQDLINTIKESFAKTWDDVADSAYNITHPEGGNLFFNIGLAIFYTIILIARFIFGFLFTTIFSVLHILVVTVMMIFVYFGFVIIAFIDKVYRTFKKISNNCPNPDCQTKYDLPVYHCPSCGAPHRYLFPSSYGIFNHRCNCGQKLPTLLINGRHKLRGTCPRCGFVAFSGLNRSSIFPVFGGRSSGKTCFINSALTEIESLAPSLGCEYEYLYDVQGDERRRFKEFMSHGDLPESTHDNSLVYYNFYFSPVNQKAKGSKEDQIRNFVSLCDISGEAFTSRETVTKQLGYRYADSTLFILDPLAISSFRDELAEQGYDVASYKCSTHQISDILGVMLTSLQELHRKKNTKQSLIVVITKGDMPKMDELLGDAAVKKYQKTHKSASDMEARDALAEQFLKDYGEANALNMIKNYFTQVHFFLTSAIGKDHVEGEAFEPVGTAAPVLWAIDKTYDNVDFKEYWRK